MILFGVIFNCICIIIGGSIGAFFSNIPETIKNSVMNGIGLVVIYIGLDMLFSTQEVLIVMMSIIFGILVGELLKIEDIFNKSGNWISKKIKFSRQTNNFNDGFIFSTVFFVVGAMSILGALESGIHGNHDILLVKGIMDGFISLIFTTTMGIGIIFSIFPLFIFQGAIVVLASQINYYIPSELLNDLITEITAVGGVLILGIGLNILGLTKIKIGNFIPSIVIVVIFFSLYKMF